MKTTLRSAMPMLPASPHDQRVKLFKELAKLERATPTAAERLLQASAATTGTDRRFRA